MVTFFKSLKFYLIAFIFSLSAYAVDVKVETNNSGCAGLLTNILRGKTQYVTISSLKTDLPEVIARKTYPNSKIDSKALRFNNAFFTNLKSIEYFDLNTSKPLDALKKNELYNFVVTKNEVRFASTSRAFNAKNISSKHALLAKNTDEVFYAGEAWLENGILVINHNSGTFRPNSKYLSDIALYLQASLGLEKVTFTDILPPPAATAKDLINDKIIKLKAYVKSKITTFEEFFVGLFARDEYFGKVVSIGIDGKEGKDIVFSVEKYIGSGFFGVVHKIKIHSLSNDTRTKFPGLLLAGSYRNDLVVKFPHNVPLLDKFPSFNLFDRSIIKEADELNKIKSIVTTFEQTGADIIFHGNGEKPFLIKQFVTASSIQNLAKNSTSLTAEQQSALKRDIFDMALMVDEKIKMDLDIKAENIAWDPDGKKFIMYEMSMKTKTTGFYIKDGFDGYLDYVTKRLQFHAAKRTPASMNEIRMCSDNVLDVPAGFKKRFISEQIDGNIDLNSNVIEFPSEEIKGCFKVESVNYYGNQEFVNLSIKIKDKTDKRVELIVARDNQDESKQYLTRFMIYLNNRVIATSIFSEAVVK